MMHCRGAYVIAMGLTLNFVAMMSGCLTSRRNSGKRVHATNMHVREDFVVGIVHK
jgi:hypothetical protein